MFRYRHFDSIFKWLVPSCCDHEVVGSSPAPEMSKIGSVCSLSTLSNAKHLEVKVAGLSV